MANYTIFGAGTPGDTFSPGDASEISVATTFYVLGVTGWRIAGIRIWIPAGMTVPSSGEIAYLWSGTGSPTSILATASFSGFVAGAWNTALFSSPVSMIAGHFYWAQVYLPSGGYGYAPSKFGSSATASVDSASLYAAGATEVPPGNGSYVMGAAGQAPGLATSGNWYGVDVVVDDGVSSSGPGSNDDVGIADTVTVVRSGLPTVIHASGAATDPMGLSASGTGTFAIGGATAFHTTRRALFDIRISWGAVINTGVKGPLFANEATGPLTLGLEFKVLWPVRFVGCKIYKAPDAHGTIPIRLWDKATGTELGNTTVTWVADSGGWREILFSSPIDLDVGVLYTVSYYSPSADYSYSQWVFYVWSDVSPPIVVPAYIAANLKGGSAFRQGTAQSIPNINTAANYYLDPIVEWDSNLPEFVRDVNRSYYDQWVNGKPANKFLMGIFGSDPQYMQEYADMGINAIYGIGAHPAFVDAIKAVGTLDIFIVAGTDQDPNKIGLNAVAEDPVFASYVKGYYIVDEPDQLVPYSPPNTVRGWCNAVRVYDSTRPLYIGMGRVVGMNQTFYHQPQGSNMDDANQLWRDWAQLSDILSGDWYNMSPDQDPEDCFGVWTYPIFTRRLRTLNEGRTPVLIAIETTSQTEGYPIPDNVRKAMWASIIEGCNGFEFFDHRFAGPTVSKDFAHMLHNPPMKAMMTAAIAQINLLVDAINGPELHLVTAVTSSNTTSGPRGGTYGVPMHYTTRADDTYEYLFAMGIRPGSTTATFTIPSWAGQTLVVIDESRTITVDGSGVLTDTFAADYTVHLYRKG